MPHILFIPVEALRVYTTSPGQSFEPFGAIWNITSREFWSARTIQPFFLFTELHSETWIVAPLERLLIFGTSTNCSIQGALQWRS
jgi:hypothetical protein